MSVDSVVLFSYLDQCRTLSVSMRNAIKHLKMKITSIPPGMPEEEVMTGIVQHAYQSVCFL